MFGMVLNNNWVKTFYSRCFGFVFNFENIQHEVSTRRKKLEVRAMIAGHPLHKGFKAIRWRGVSIALYIREILGASVLHKVICGD